jgi:hypothetical protein
MPNLALGRFTHSLRFRLLALLACFLLLASRSLAQEFASERPNVEVEDFDISTSTDVTSDKLVGGLSGERLKELMMPTLSIAAEMQAQANALQLSTLQVGISVPTYPIFGPPPPIVNLGLVYTDVDSPSTFGLPQELYEARMGMAWIRRFNERWTVRLMAGTSFATDRLNTSSDAWQFRGGVFGIYQKNPRWTWTFGAIALGRNDLPVLPAVGLIYQPHSRLRFDLLMPRPRISWMITESNERQQWSYIGAGLNGTTWGVQRDDGTNDQLTYGDVRFVIGWESTPKKEPGVPFTRGRKMAVEAGYVISRDFEWESSASIIDLDDTFLVRASVSF